MGGYFSRLLKAFLISSVAVFTFINGPSIYQNIRYAFGSSPAPIESPIVQSAYQGEVINPVILPLANAEIRSGTTPTPSVINATPTPTNVVVATPLPGSAILSIPKINVSVPIVFGIPSVAEKIYANLTNGVVHYSATPKPGESGASVILGHSSLYPWQVNKYGAPFALLGKLRPGDTMTVTYSGGKTYTYLMKQSIVFNPLESESDARLAEFEKSTKPLLLLVTCWPVNSNKSRIALQAELQ